jgi:hypothetical protein
MRLTPSFNAMVAQRAVRTLEDWLESHLHPGG